MASFLSQSSANGKWQLALTAAVSAALAAGAILGFQALQREEHLSQLKSSIPAAVDDDAPIKGPSSSLESIPNADKDDQHNFELARRAQAGDFDEELVHEQLARNRVFLTEPGLARLRGAFVVVVGCGGVGSHAAAALARSGCARIRLVDFDQVTLSSLNRHAVATLADVGLSKVLCLKRRLAAIAPWVGFDLRVEKFDKESADRLLGPWTVDAGDKGVGDAPAFVIDAIDNIDTKVELLRYCYEQKLPVISSMGAGLKSDPTRLTVGDIGLSTDDALSRAVRRRLKLLGITSGIPVVFSTEKGGEGKAELLPLPEHEFQRGKVGDLGVLPDFRVRILPVLGTMPAMFGLTVANYIILRIADYPVVYAPPNTRSKVYESLQAAVQGGEEKIVRWQSGGSPDTTLGLKVPISAHDAAFLVDEIYLARSVISGIYTRITLIRWRKPQHDILVRIGLGSDEQKSTGVRLRDLVCMTKEEAVIHEREILRGDKRPEDLYGQDVVDRAEARMTEAAAYEKYKYLT